MFYDECELEWIALAGAGPAERIEFHKNLPELQMITELNARVHYLKKLLGPAPRVGCIYTAPHYVECCTEHLATPLTPLVV